jgi:hypothetical protein
VAVLSEHLSTGLFLGDDGTPNVTQYVPVLPVAGWGSKRKREEEGEGREGKEPLSIMSTFAERVQYWCHRLSDLKLELAGEIEDAQTCFRIFVTDKQHPLEDRFEVWTQWCEKKDHRCVINASDVPLIGQMVQDREPGDYFRHEVFDWSYFLEALEEPEMREKYSVTTDDVKELLIKHNFGSFRMDW